MNVDENAVERDVPTYVTTAQTQKPGAWDHYSDDSTRSSDARSTSSVEEPKRSTRKRPSPIPRDSNRSRLERRYEVWSLREQVAALEIRLRELQLQAKLNNPSEKRASSSHSRALTRQAVAKCQHDRLVMAENKRTIQQKWIRKYKSTIKRVETLLRMQTFPTSLVRNDLGLPLTAARGFQAVDGFEEISRGVSSMYLQLDGIFRDPCFHPSTHDMYEFRVQNEATAQFSFEILESRLVPFSIQATATAMWHFHQIKAKDAVDEMGETDNAIRRTFILSMDTPTQRFQSFGRMEVRWFVDHDRVVFLQHAVFNQAEQISGVVPEGYIVRQYQWTVIGPPRHEELGASGRAMCQFERYEVLIPFKEGSSLGQNVTNDQAAMKQVVRETSNQVRAYERDVMETFLLRYSPRSK